MLLELTAKQLLNLAVPLLDSTATERAMPVNLLKVQDSLSELVDRGKKLSEDFKSNTPMTLWASDVCRILETRSTGIRGFFFGSLLITS